MPYRPRTIISRKLSTEQTRERVSRVEVESPGARLLSVICKRSMKVGRASTSSAARKANAGFHALR